MLYGCSLLLWTKPSASRTACCPVSNWRHAGSYKLILKIASNKADSCTYTCFYSAAQHGLSRPNAQNHSYSEYPNTLQDSFQRITYRKPRKKTLAQTNPSVSNGGRVGTPESSTELFQKYLWALELM